VLLCIVHKSQRRSISTNLVESWIDPVWRNKNAPCDFWLLRSMQRSLGDHYLTASSIGDKISAAAEEVDCGRLYSRNEIRDNSDMRSSENDPLPVFSFGVSFCYSPRLNISYNRLLQLLLHFSVNDAAKIIQ